MESLTSAISVQVDAYDKEVANSILKKLGLNMSTYVNMAIKQLINKDGIPFEVVNPRQDNLQNYFTKEELEEAAKELKYISSHMNEYKENNKWEDLKAELSNEKI